VRKRVKKKKRGGDNGDRAYWRERERGRSEKHEKSTNYLVRKGRCGVREKLLQIQNVLLAGTGVQGKNCRVK